MLSFADEILGAQRYQATCLKSHSGGEAELSLESSHLAPGLWLLTAGYLQPFFGTAVVLG